MNSKEKELRDNLEDKLYYNLYNPKDGVALTDSQSPSITVSLPDVD
tara:strand:- start:524 stop:661 length:138 start_codon:yes stop_codon:yes gene_type:complete